MNISAAIAEMEVRIHCRKLSSRHDHTKGARPRKRGDDAPGRGRTGVQAGGLATQSVNILFKDASLPRGTARLSRPPSLTLPHIMGEGWEGGGRRTVMNNAG